MRITTMEQLQENIGKAVSICVNKNQSDKHYGVLVQGTFMDGDGTVVDVEDFVNNAWVIRPLEHEDISILYANDPAFGYWSTVTEADLIENIIELEEV